MATTVMKVELETDTCCVCGGGGELQTPEEHDASATVMLAPLRAMLLHLNNNKVVPDGRFCADCIRRTVDSYEFSAALSTKSAPPLSEKIRALRRRLHELTQKIDVFIVVGGPGVNAGGTYSEDDIIMVEKEALAAGAAADDEDLERARNTRGDTVYQCSVCPQSFQRVVEYRAHAATHAPDALHSCWTCGAQFAARAALRDHAAEHSGLATLVCHLCNTTFTSQAELRRHAGACGGACPLCGAWCGARAALAAHAQALHARSRPALCAACFLALPGPGALAAHMLRHRQAKQYVCGYDGCILRFGTRSVTHARSRPALCAACFLALPGPGALAAHMLRHRQAKQYVCGYDGCILRFGTRSVTHARSRPALCAACFLALPGPGALAAHMLRHRQAKQYVCGYDGCILRFGTRSVTHARSRPALCAACFLALPGPGALAAHMLRHRQAKQYVCGYDGCILRFGTRSVTHARSRPALCAACFLALPGPGALAAHMLRHRQAKQYVCGYDGCILRFGTRSVTHARSRPALCAACFLALPGPGALAAHMLRHRQAKQYVCGYDGCILRFGTRSVTHARSRPALCAACFLALPGPGALAAHMLRHRQAKQYVCGYDGCILRFGTRSVTHARSRPALCAACFLALPGPGALAAHMLRHRQAKQYVCGYDGCILRFGTRSVTHARSRPALCAACFLALPGPGALAAHMLRHRQAKQYVCGYDGCILRFGTRSVTHARSRPALCAACFLALPGPGALAAHMLRHRQAKQYVCGYDGCILRFGTRSVTHARSRPALCAACFLALPGPGALAAHMLRHRQAKQYVCGYDGCILRFGTRSVTHARSRPALCAACFLALPGPGALAAHMLRHRQAKQYVCGYDGCILRFGTRSVTHARSRPALCAACFLALPGPGALAAHMLRHRQAKQYVCGYDGCILRFGTRSVTHARSRPALCAACFLALPGPGALAAHMLRHRQAKQYVCGYDGCILRFGTRSVTHARSRPALCAACFLALPGPGALAAHMLRHRQAKQYVCGYDGCILRFGTRSVTHARSRPALCAACFLALPGPGALAAHMLRHRQAKQYVCGYDGCILRFGTRSVTHARSRPALCAACFLALPGPGALAAHMLRHRQAKQYVCGYDGCILRFGTRANLMSHIRKCHAGAAEPADPAAASTTCAQCQRTFASVAAMKRHARVHRNRNEAAIVEEGNGSQEGNESQVDVSTEEMELVAADAQEGDVEYLEVETLDEIEYQAE